MAHSRAGATYTVVIHRNVAKNSKTIQQWKLKQKINKMLITLLLYSSSRLCIIYRSECNNILTGLMMILLLVGVS